MFKIAPLEHSPSFNRRPLIGATGAGAHVEYEDGDINAMHVTTVYPR